MIGENANNAFVSFIQNTQFSLVLCKSTFSCCVQEPFLSKNLRCWLPWLFVGKRESVFLVSFLSVPSEGALIMELITLGMTI